MNASNLKPLKLMVPLLWFGLPINFISMEILVTVA